jgi:hypothetical protein
MSSFNYKATVNGETKDLGNYLTNKSSVVTINPTKLTKQITSINYDTKRSIYENNITVDIDGYSNIGDTVITFGQKKQSIMVAVGTGANTIAYSTDGGLTWTGLGATIFTANNFTSKLYGKDKSTIYFL